MAMLTVPTVAHLDQSSESVLVTGITPGAYVTVYRNGTAIASAVAGSDNTRVALTEGLTPGDVVTATQMVSDQTSAFSNPVTVELNHTTHQFNRQRTGWNPYETLLNVTNVGDPRKFGLLFNQPVDGQVYAQPLYVQNVEFTRKDFRGKTTTAIGNVLYVATEKGWVYAFDADNFAPPLAQRRLIPTGERAVEPGDILSPVKQRISDPGLVGAVVGFVVGAIVGVIIDGIGIIGGGIVGAIGGAILGYIGGVIYGNNGNNYQSPCPNISPYICITATPVIDRTTNTLFVTAKTAQKDGGRFYWRLYKLDLATLADQQPPVVIAASVPGTGLGSSDGIIKFDSQWQLNRPALLLSKGAVYVAFGSHCDFGPYHGWLMAYDATDLKMLGVFNTSPNDYLAGIWLSGCGAAADADGNIYVATGNGSFSTEGRNYGQSVLKLKLELVYGRPGPVAMQPGSVPRSAFPPHYELTLVDHFTPYDWQHINPDWDPDADIGSGGVMLLPPQPEGLFPRRLPAPAPPDLLFACGKSKGIYLLNPANLGGWSRGDPGLLQYPPQKIGTEVFGGPAYFVGPAPLPERTGHYVYYCGHHGPLKAFSVAGATLSLATQSSDTFPGPDEAGGAIPTVSSSGSTAGSGIVWVVGRGGSMNLFAYNAADVSVKLFQGEAGFWDNPGGSPFIVPTVIHGKVYVGTANQVAFFGLGTFKIGPSGILGWLSILGRLRDVIVASSKELMWWWRTLVVFIQRWSFSSLCRGGRRK